MVSEVGEYDAVVTSVTGKGHIISFNNFVLDSDDNLSEGFLLQ